MLWTMLSQTIRFPVTPTASLLVNDLYFPLASAPAAFWSSVRPDGGDIRVYTQDGTTRCACEVGCFDYGNKSGSLFFAVNGGTAFYVCAGSGEDAATPGSEYGSYNVWGVNSKLIAHMSNMSNSASALYQGSSPNPPSFVAGKIGNCGQFNCSDTYVDFGALTGVSARTIDLWFNVNAYAGYPMMVTGAGFEIASSQGGNRKPYFYSSGSGVVSSPNTISSGGWHKLTVTIDAVAGMILYMDGSNVASNPGLTSLSLSAGNLLFGKRSDGNYYTGKLDEVRIWDTSLSAAAVAQKYANQNDPATFWTIGDAG